MTELEWLREQAGTIEVVAKGLAEPATRALRPAYRGPAAQIWLAAPFTVREIDVLIAYLTITRRAAVDYDSITELIEQRDKEGSE